MLRAGKQGQLVLMRVKEAVTKVNIRTVREARPRREKEEREKDFLKVLRTFAISGLVLPVRRTFHSCSAPNLRIQENFSSWGVIHALLCVIQ